MRGIVEIYTDDMMRDVEGCRSTGESWGKIAATYSLHPEQIRGAYRRWKKRNRLTIWDGVLPEGGIRPFDLDYPVPTVEREPWRGKEGWVQLVFGDAHVPFECKQSVSILLAVLEDLQPDSVVNLGDHQDAYMLSDFLKDPNRKETLQDEINLGRALHLSIRNAAPNSTYDVFEGNHEERLRRALWRADKTATILMQLTNVQKELSWPRLFDLDGLGATWHPTGTISEIGPDFYAHHGDVKGDPFSKFGVSGISGHIHKFKMETRRSVKEQLEWFTCPTMGTLNPEYDCHPQWQNGFWVFTHNATTGTRLAEMVRIQNGKAIFRDTVYSA